MARKRQRSNFSHNLPPSLSKRLRYQPPSSSSSLKPETQTPLTNEEPNEPRRQTASMVVVTGLSNGCSVLSVKSRFEIYGCISRIRIDHGIGYINFRSKDAAQAAIAASLDPSFGITIDSQKVHVSWPNDPLPEWREGVRVSVKERLSSRLLQPEVPLSRHGRGNKLGSSTTNPKNGLDLSYKARDIIAYDDLF